MQALSFIKNRNARGNREGTVGTVFTSSSLFLDSNRAIVSDDITAGRRGRIYYQDTYWFGCALNDVDILKGAVVELLERRGNTWLVKPIAARASKPEIVTNWGS
jgi:membrane protein implicated in regulation of membrane protease activity